MRVVSEPLSSFRLKLDFAESSWLLLETRRLVGGADAAGGEGVDSNRMIWR